MDWRRKVECRRPSKRCFSGLEENRQGEGYRERTESRMSPRFCEEEVLFMGKKNTRGRVGLAGGDDGPAEVSVRHPEERSGGQSHITESIPGEGLGLEVEIVEPENN